MLACSFAISGGFRTLAVASSGGLLLIYLGCSLAILELRRRDVRATEHVFRAPGGALVPLASSAVVVWLLSNLTAREATTLVVVLLVCTVYYFARRWLKARKER